MLQCLWVISLDLTHPNAICLVTGENFGMEGSRTILRVDGRPARTCKYPVGDFIMGNAPKNEKLLREHCRNGVWDYGEDGVDCGGSDCQLCRPRVLPDHCLNGILEEDLGETGAVSLPLPLDVDALAWGRMQS